MYMGQMGSPYELLKQKVTHTCATQYCAIICNERVNIRL